MSARAKYPPLKRGDRFGRWTVVRPATNGTTSKGTSAARVLVRCECGAERVAFTLELNRGDTSGCLSVACRNKWESERGAT